MLGKQSGEAELLQIEDRPIESIDYMEDLSRLDVRAPSLMWRGRPKAGSSCGGYGKRRVSCR